MTPTMVPEQVTWARSGAVAVTRRTKVIIGVMVLFLVSWLFVLQPERGVSIFGFSIFGLNDQPASGKPVGFSSSPPAVPAVDPFDKTASKSPADPSDKSTAKSPAEPVHHPLGESGADSSDKSTAKHPVHPVDESSDKNKADSPDSSTAKHSDDHKDEPIKQPAKTGADTPPEAQPPMVGGLKAPGSESSILSPGPDSVLLTAASNSLTSPNGRYSLILHESGNLVLYHLDPDGPSRSVWSTGTGNHHERGRYVAVETLPDDHFRIVIKVLVGQQDWVTVWHSDLTSACSAKGKGKGHNRRDAQEDMDNNNNNNKALIKLGPGQLELSNHGKLSIVGLCDLYVPPEDSENDRRLAVIIAGHYRTNPFTCTSQMNNLIRDNPTFKTIDVFMFVLRSKATQKNKDRSPEAIEKMVRSCYGDYVKTIDIVNEQDIEEDWPGVKPKIAKAPQCTNFLLRHRNQLKTLSVAADKWWAWSVKNGVTYDTVLRIRPDHDVNEQPQFKTLSDMGHNLIIQPNPSGEHYYYCAMMRGNIRVGTTDQVAYGSPNAMLQWLHMFKDFAQVINLAGDSKAPAKRDISGCEEVPSGPLSSDCSNPAPCSIECLVAWYLDTRGIEGRVDWSWAYGTRR